MDDPRYMRLYSIEGGIEKLVKGIVDATSEMLLHSETQAYVLKLNLAEPIVW
jgi:hypothetical protein